MCCGGRGKHKSSDDVPSVKFLSCEGAKIDFSLALPVRVKIVSSKFSRFHRPILFFGGKKGNPEEEKVCEKKRVSQEIYTAEKEAG